ncbi:MAG TPA: hypothetical protein VEY50_10560 [Lysobacter sp.]|nr:hypothetical protein [Lysobacter sp.]
MNTVDAATRRRNRIALIAIAVIFFGSFGLAGVLRLSGWRPAGLKNHGELLQPPGDARRFALATVDGTPYRWQPEARLWRIAVAAPARCGVPCARLATDLEKVRLLQSREAGRLHLLWIGDYPAAVPRSPALRQLPADSALRTALPRLDDARGIPVYVIDPNGFVILRYAPGADPAGLRADLAKLLKLR